MIMGIEGPGPVAHGPIWEEIMIKKLLHLSNWKAKELVLMRCTALSSSDGRYTTGNIELELPRKVQE